MYKMPHIIPGPVGSAQHSEKQCYKLFSICSKGKCRAYVVKILGKIEQHLNLILLLNNAEMFKSV